MLNSFDLINNIIVSLTSGIILYEFYALFFIENKKHIGLKIFSWLIYLGWQFSILNLSQIPWYIKLVINCVLIIIVACINYNGNLIQKCVFSIALCAIWTLSEILIGYVFLIFDLHITKFDILGSVISKFLLFILIIVIRRITPYNNDLSIKYNLIIGGIAGGSIFIISILFYISDQNINSYTLPMELICSFILLLINILIFKIYSKLGEQIELQKENLAYVRQLELYDQYLITKEEELETNRKLKHDLKQYCIYLLRMFEERDYAKGIEFLQDMIEYRIDKKKNISNTDNIVVDAIINYKYPQMVDNDIGFLMDLDIPTHVNVDNPDLALILGNLLDNAIEASKKINNEMRSIRLNMKSDMGNLYISMHNNYDGNIKLNQHGVIKTLKYDSQKHGFGLSSVQKCIEKYNGVLNISYDQKSFHVEVLIYSEI